MRFIYFTLFFAFTTSLVAQTIKTGKTGFVSPTKEENPSLTGSFAEIRPNHFHAGLDFSTDGVIGKKLYAIGDGYISRIKVSHTGYGKALYITHYNGFTSVYGHLDEYNSTIDSLVTAIQYEKRSFNFDQYFEKDQYKVKSGDFIALSGNSGHSGGPHLHFELRDTESEWVVNPLFHILGVKDKIAPIVNAIVIYPLSENSTINGKRASQQFEVVKVGNKLQLKDNPVIKVAGTFGVGVKSYDLLDGSPRKCGIYSLSVRENDNSVFYVDLYSFSFDESRYVNSLSDYKAKISNNETIIRGYIEPNNHLSIYKKTINRGEMIVGAGKKSALSIEVADGSKNISKIDFTITGAKEIADASKSSKSGKLITCNEQLTKEISSISFTFEPASIYKDFYLTASMSEVNKLYNSPVYTLGSREVPIHSKVDVSIKIPSNLTSKSKHLTVCRINKSEKLEYVGGAVEDGRFKFSIREFGRYVFAVDSLGPALSFFKLPKENDYKGRRYLAVTATDKCSEIAAYEGYIDGKWVLFEYDEKNDLLLCPLAKAPIARNKKHKLSLTVTDKMGNKKKITLDFKY